MRFEKLFKSTPCLKKYVPTHLMGGARIMTNNDFVRIMTLGALQGFLIFFFVKSN